MYQFIRLFVVASALVTSSVALAQGGDAGGVRNLQLPQGAYSIRLTKVEYPTVGQAVTYDEACIRYQQSLDGGSTQMCASYSETRSDLVSVTIQYTVGHGDPNRESEIDPMSVQEEKMAFYPRSFSANVLNQIANSGGNSSNLARNLFSTSTHEQSSSREEAGSDSPMCATDENGQLPFNGAYCQGEQTHTVTDHFTILSVQLNAAARN